MRPLEIVAPTGSLVNVQYPAPVSLNTTSSAAIVRYLANAVVMRMLATTETWRKEVTAVNAGHRNAKHAGVNQFQSYFVSPLALGALDGTGARSHRDGVESGGGQMSSPNVEWYEQNFPVLYLFRRHVRDGAGAGKYRGGRGAETAHILHDAPEGKIKGVTYGVAGMRNSGQGIFGGYPGAPSVTMLLEDTRVNDLFSENKCVEDLAEVGGNLEIFTLQRVRSQKGRYFLYALGQRRRIRGSFGESARVGAR